MNFTACEAVWLHGCSPFDQLNFHTSVPCLIAVQERCEHAFNHVRHRCDLKYSRLSFFESKRPIHEQIGGSQQLAALPKQILAFDRQLQTAANELKEWHAE